MIVPRESHARRIRLVNLKSLNGREKAIKIVRSRDENYVRSERTLIGFDRKNLLFFLQKVLILNLETTFKFFVCEFIYIWNE